MYNAIKCCKNCFVCLINKTLSLIDIKTSRKLFKLVSTWIWFLHECKPHISYLCANTFISLLFFCFLSEYRCHRCHYAIDQQHTQNGNSMESLSHLHFMLCHVVFHYICHFRSSFFFVAFRNWNWWYIVFSTL